jgi:preprotein translocase subunit SecD
MRRRLWATLISTVVIVVVLFIGAIATGTTPILGLDLQGGVSVILAPVEPASGDDLIVIRDLIRSELENQGIAEPDVRVQGQALVVDLPGVKDQQQALDAVDVSGVVELRPVVEPAQCAAAVPPDDVSATTIASGTAPAAPATTTPASATTAPAGFRGAFPAQTVPAPEPVVTEPATEPVPALPTATGAELLPTRDGTSLCVGPAQGTGEVFSRGSAALTADNGWGVSVDLRGDGEATWNSLAGQCYNAQPTCPSTAAGVRGQIAIALDSVVQSAPQVNQPSFAGSVAITGSFSKGEAEDLAAVLNRGAFPVEVKAQEARIVSPSAGADSLNAAIVAGVIGILLVLAMLFAYYRWMTLVILIALAVWGLFVFGVASLISGWTNYALTLAGVTGIIVSIGVTVDSYVVFFERLKDELRGGRTFRNATPRSWNATWRTIWAANLVSIIGAVILFVLSVGSVRGFALYLGVTAFCDLLILYTFTRPFMLLLASSAYMRNRSAFGIKPVAS